MNLGFGYIFFHFLWLLEQFFGKSNTDSTYKLRLKVHNSMKTKENWGPNQIFNCDAMNMDFLSRKRLRELPKDRPVVLKGLAKSLLGIKELSVDSLVNHQGEILQPIYNYDVNGLKFNNKKLKDFIQDMNSGADRKSALYTGDIFAKAPELVEALHLTKWIDPNIFKRAVNFSFLAFLSPKNSRSFLHNEMAHILNVQLWGKKRWYLVSPNQSYRFMPDVNRGMFLSSRKFTYGENFLKEDLGLTVWECELAPGDVLWCPRFTWHYVEAAEDSFSVAVKWNYFSVLFRHPILSLIILTSRNPYILEFLFKSSNKKVSPTV